MKSFLWVAYEKDPPYLPCAIADSAQELAKKTGTTELTVYSAWSK